MRQVFEAANELVAEHVIDTYAIGGAIGASFYIEAAATEDVDIFFHVTPPPPRFQELSAVYQYLRKRGCVLKGEFVVIDDWDVQFLMPAEDSIESEAVERANAMNVQGVDVRVMMPEYLCAIALNTERQKDIARVRAFIEQDKVNVDELKVLITRFHLEEPWQKVQERS